MPGSLKSYMDARLVGRRGWSGALSNLRLSLCPRKIGVRVKRQLYARFVVAVLLASVSWNCKNTVAVNNGESSQNASVWIQLEADFQDDSVKVEFDSQELFAGRLRTNYSISLAWSSDVLIVPAGIHAVRVSVFSGGAASQFFTDLRDTVTVTANYNRQSRQLIFRTVNHIILRD